APRSGRRAGDRAGDGGDRRRGDRGDHPRADPVRPRRVHPVGASRSTTFDWSLDMVFRSRGGREAPAESENAPASAAGLSAPLIVGAAAVPSVASLVWTAWSIADMVPAPWP